MPKGDRGHMNIRWYVLGGYLKGYLVICMYLYKDEKY